MPSSHCSTTASPISALNWKIAALEALAFMAVPTSMWTSEFVRRACLFLSVDAFVGAASLSAIAGSAGSDYRSNATLMPGTAGTTLIRIGREERSIGDVGDAAFSMHHL